MKRKRPPRLFPLLMLGISVWGHNASAATVLKDVAVNGPGRVEITFDQPVTRNQIQVETLRDIVQVNLKDVSIYPAKIVPVQGQPVIQKIFAYQYTPSLVRFRVTVNGDAKAYDGKVRVSPNGKTLILDIPNAVSAGSTTGTTPSASSETPVPAVQDKVAIQSSSPLSVAKEPIKLTPAENQMLKTVTGGGLGGSTGNGTNPKVGSKSAKSEKADSFNIGKAIMAFFFVLVAAIAGLFLLKRIRKGGRFEWKALLGKWSGSGILGRGKMIEVVATHFLGPKKSIAVVRVKGRLLLVGISNESINLITELGDEHEIESGLDAALGAALSSRTSAGAITSPAPTGASAMENEKAALRTQVHAAMAEPPAPRNVSFRDQIRKRVEGMKSL